MTKTGDGTIVLTGGYSSGHFTPGLAVAEWVKRALPEAKILFMGSSDGPEGEWCRAAGMPFLGLPVNSIRYRSIPQRLAATGAFLRATRTAWRAFDAHSTRMVVGLGSYASVAPVLAAHLSGRPVVAFEPNASTGRANRLASLRAAHFSVSPLWSGRDAGVNRAYPPLRRGLIGNTARAVPDGRPLRLLVLGGSLGHGFLNQNGPSLAGALRTALMQESGGTVPDLVVRHQSGWGSATSALEAAYRERGVETEVAPFWADIQPQYSWADFAITAAGSLTLHELAALRLPSLVVPLRLAADDHQRANALAYSRETGAMIAEEDSWDPSAISSQLAALWQRRDFWERAWASLEAFDRGSTAEPWETAIRRLWQTPSL